jgi:hypothetical protein
LFAISKAVGRFTALISDWEGQEAPVAKDTWTDPKERGKHPSLQKPRSSSQLPHLGHLTDWEVQALQQEKAEFQLDLLLTRCDKVIVPSEPQLISLHSGDIIPDLRVVMTVREKNFVMCLMQSLGPSRCSETVGPLLPFPWFCLLSLAFLEHA